MTKEQLIAELNNDLAREYAAIIQYITYASQVKGPFRPELSKFFLAEVADEQGHAQFLADKIVTLGGVPTTVPSEVPAAKTTRDMLAEVHKAESAAIQNYTKRAEQAEALGFKSLAMDLEDMIRDETNHKEETEKILAEWPE